MLFKVELEVFVYDLQFVNNFTESSLFLKTTSCIFKLASPLTLIWDGCRWDDAIAKGERDIDVKLMDCSIIHLTGFRNKPIIEGCKPKGWFIGISFIELCANKHYRSEAISGLKTLINIFVFIVEQMQEWQVWSHFKSSFTPNKTSIKLLWWRCLHAYWCVQFERYELSECWKPWNIRSISSEYKPELPRVVFSSVASDLVTLNLELILAHP